MAKYVPDVKTQRWVIISPQRNNRPADAEAMAGKPDSVPALSERSESKCPFCMGSEAQTPPEVYRIGPGEPNAPGWQVRVVPNKFPITDVHEVILHSPDHTKDIEALPLDQVARILTSYRDRFRAHEADGQVLIFCNHGLLAGASLTHPHSQLVVVPKQINLDTLEREPITNLVVDNKNFITYCPDFSQWPLEVWIAPKVEGSRFSDVSDAELPDLAELLITTLKKIQGVQAGSGMPHMPQMPFVYNFYIYHGSNWYLRIIPRLVYRAGFELGTGLSVNITDPSEAAKLLKSTS